MKRIKYVLLFMFILFITINVKAETLDYYLSNSAQNYEYVNKDNNKAINVKRGDYIYVTSMFDHKNLQAYYRLTGGKLTVRWDEKYLSLEEVDGKYYNDANTDLKLLKIGSVSKYANRVVLNDLSILSNYIPEGKVKVVEFKFRVLDDANSGVTKIYQMDGEDTLECICDICGGSSPPTSTKCSTSLYSELKYNITKSTVNKLSMIKLDGQELEAFSEDNNSYDITVETDVTKIKIEATKKDSKSTITGDIGEKQVSYGNNKFEINVTSEAGTKNIYVLNVNRIDERSNDNTLKTLTLSEGEIKYKPETLEYTINVENKVDKITITSTLSDSKAKYVTDFKNKTVDLVEGSNKIEIKVVSEKGEEKTYTLNINRALSDNSSLKTLTINDEKIKLLDNEFIYNITVENDVDEVIIKAETNDERATVKLNEKYPLEIGENEIKFKVIAASGGEASYIINVTRKKILSKDSLLSSLKIKNYTINFKQDQTVYDLKIKDEDNELEITTTTEDVNATVEIEGNKNLSNGSIIKINVKAEDGTYTRYFINIEKGSGGISPIIIILIILLLLLGGCIGLLIYRKKKQEKDEFDKLEIIDDEKEVDNTEEIPTQEYVGVHEEKNIDEKEKDV